MSVKTFTLNGELVSAGEDQTILDVCDEQKVPIPRLCHLEGLGEIDIGSASGVRRLARSVASSPFGRTTS